MAKTTRAATGTATSTPELNKFTRSISTGDSALAERAILVGRAAKIAQENLVRDLEGKVNSNKLEIYKLCDISPENSQDTKPRGLAAENPTEWVKQLHQLKVKTALLEEELAIAQDTLNEWF